MLFDKKQTKELDDKRNEQLTYGKIRLYKNIDVGLNTRTKARQDVDNNTTKELSVGDFVRVKLSQLYSQVCKMVKDHEK